MTAEKMSDIQTQNLAMTGQRGNSFWEVLELKVLTKNNEFLLETAKNEKKDGKPAHGRQFRRILK